MGNCSKTDMFLRSCSFVSTGNETFVLESVNIWNKSLSCALLGCIFSMELCERQVLA